MPIDNLEDQIADPNYKLPLSSCPSCGCEVYQIKIAVSGTIIERHNFNGTPAYNGQMYDGLRHRQRKRIHCDECGIFLGNFNP